MPRNPIVQRLTYGTNEVGECVATEHGGFRRVDTYRPDRPESYQRDGIRESYFAAARDDVSYPTGYDSRCSCCYLGFSHTEDLHKRATAKRRIGVAS